MTARQIAPCQEVFLETVLAWAGQRSGQGATVVLNWRSKEATNLDGEFGGLKFALRYYGNIYKEFR